jgi:hypothetical protein
MVAITVNGLLISLLFPFMKKIAIKYNATELAWEFIQDEGN